MIKNASKFFQIGVGNSHVSQDGRPGIILEFASGVVKQMNPDDLKRVYLYKNVFSGTTGDQFVIYGLVPTSSVSTASGPTVRVHTDYREYEDIDDLLVTVSENL